MFEAASPRKVRRLPAVVPLCSCTVRRSASTWHGWKASVSAFTTGTPAYSAISSRLDWWKVRHTIAVAWRPRTRAVSATDSRLADLGEPGVDHHREPAELGDA